MARNYTGNFDGGKYNDLLGNRKGGESGGGMATGGKFGMASKMMINNGGMNKKQAKKTPAERRKEYMDAMRLKSEEAKGQALIAAKANDMKAAGNVDISKFSKAAQFMLQRMLEKKRKKREAENQRVKIVQTTVRNGRIDSSGRILTTGGRIVATINRKNGAIENKLGLRLGKYEPYNNTCLANIERIIDNFRLQTQAVHKQGSKQEHADSWFLGGGDKNQQHADSWFLGGGDKNKQGGSDWFWGGKKDDKGGW